MKTAPIYHRLTLKADKIQVASTTGRVVRVRKVVSEAKIRADRNC